MEAVLQGFAGSFLAAWLAGRLRRLLSFASEVEVGLTSYAMFLALAVWVVAGDRTVPHALLAASAIVALWGGFLRVMGRESSIAMIGGDALAVAALVRMGIAVPFLTAPSGGFIYLGSTASFLSWAWLFTFVVLLKLANRLPGLFTGITALLSYLLLGSLLYQQQHTPEAFLLLSILAGVSTGMWLNSFSDSSKRLGRVSCSLWAVTLGAISIVSTSKKVATVAVLSPVGLGLAPLAFFCFVILRSYFLPRVRARREERQVIRMTLSEERLTGVLLLFSLLVNLVTLLVLFSASIPWAVGLSILGGTVFARVAGLVLFDPADKKGPKPGRSVEILGVPIVRRALDEHLARVREWLRGGPPRLVITPDSLAVLRSTEEEEYGSILRDADLILPDGSGVIWAGDFLHAKPVLDRIPGVDFVQRLLELAAEEGAPVYLLGTTDAVLEKSVAAFRARWPDLEIAGTRNGFFDLEADSPDIADAIRASGAALCLVAMGVPRQELWMKRWAERTGCKVLMGVGGSLDVLSGSLERAPKAFQELGLEWLYRVLRQPKRLMRAFHLPRFVMKVLEEKISRDSRGRK